MLKGSIKSDEEEVCGEIVGVRDDENWPSNYNDKSSTSEIEEWKEVNEIEVVGMDSIKEEYELGSSFSWVNQNTEEECVYVGIGKMESSMDALVWTLNHAVTSSSTLVYLLHVFPETRFVPSPLGKLPKSQVSPEQLENYMAQERRKRSEFLHKFIDTCDSAKVKVDTILIESDTVSKAILDLIPILNIRKLVLGRTKSRKASRSWKGSGVVNQILENAQEFCEVKIICEGKEVVKEQMRGSTCPSPSLSPSPSSRFHDDSSSKNNVESSTTVQQEDKRNDSFSFMCFKPAFM